MSPLLIGLEKFCMCVCVCVYKKRQFNVFLTERNPFLNFIVDLWTYSRKPRVGVGANCDLPVILSCPITFWVNHYRSTSECLWNNQVFKSTRIAKVPKWLNKRWSIYTPKCYVATKKNDATLNILIWNNF